MSEDESTSRTSSVQGPVTPPKQTVIKMILVGDYGVGKYSIPLQRVFKNLNARIKVILVGDYGVGKSSLFRRFVYNAFVESNDRASTLGFDHFQKTYTIQGRKIVLQLWDTGGMERIASVTTSYFKHADAALLCFSYDAYDSFNSLPHHLLEVLTSADAAKLFLCGNKVDKRGSGMGPTQEDVDKFIRENQINEHENLFKAQYSTSCKTGRGVHDMFEDIAARMLNLIQPPMPDYIRLTRQSTDQSTGSTRPSSGCCSGGGQDSATASPQRLP